MIGLRINTAKSIPFRAGKIISATDKATRRIFMRFGAFVRRTARTSIRKRKRISEPGRPPSSHTGLLRRLIFFAYDRVRTSVVIGPERPANKPADVTQALEHGGVSTALFTSDGRKRRQKVRIRARPFMQPAFDKERPGLPAMWRHSIK